MLGEADWDMTEAAMQGSNARFANDKSLLVKFFNQPMFNQTKSTEEGRPIYTETLHVQIIAPGNKENIVCRPATEMDKRRFAEHLRRYEARQDAKGYEGTPLEEWPGITRSLAEELKFFNIHTVEQLAGVSDVNAQNIMGINLLKSKAAAYLEASAANANAEALAAANARIDELQNALNRMQTKPPEKAEKKG